MCHDTHHVGMTLNDGPFDLQTVFSGHAQTETRKKQDVRQQHEYVFIHIFSLCITDFLDNLRGLFGALFSVQFCF